LPHLDEIHDNAYYEDGIIDSVDSILLIDGLNIASYPKSDNAGIFDSQGTPVWHRPQPPRPGNPKFSLVYSENKSVPFSLF